jgi:hypothetical protein
MYDFYQLISVQVTLVLPQKKEYENEYNYE